VYASAAGQHMTRTPLNLAALLQASMHSCRATLDMPRGRGRVAARVADFGRAKALAGTVCEGTAGGQAARRQEPAAGGQVARLSQPAAGGQVARRQEPAAGGQAARRHGGECGQGERAHAGSAGGLGAARGAAGGGQHWPSHSRAGVAYEAAGPVQRRRGRSAPHSSSALYDVTVAAKRQRPSRDAGSLFPRNADLRSAQGQS
jgi:hypothetical protein